MEVKGYSWFVFLPIRNLSLPPILWGLPAVLAWGSQRIQVDPILGLLEVPELVKPW